MTDAVTADELRQFIERHEQLDAETSDIAAQRSDLMAELRGRGYDGKAFKEVIRLRKMKADERAEREAVLDVYLSALGMI
jgi:uncharacterized protein (UPF0335 family)